MSEVKTNVLTPADNIVNLCGVLKSMEAVKTTNPDLIMLNCVIAPAPDSEIRVSLSANRMTKGGNGREAKENGWFKGLETVRNNFVSVASLVKQGMSAEEAYQKADKVMAVSASLELREYYDQQEQLHSSVSVRANSLSRIDPALPYTPMAKAELVGFIERIVPEMKGEDETGRLKMDVDVPGWSGRIMPMHFVTKKGAVTEYINDHYHKNDTVRLFVEIVNTLTVVKQEVHGFAGSETKETTTRVNELLVYNGSEEPYDEDSKLAYKLADIQNAMRVRETEYLPGLKKKNEERRASKSANTGFATSPTFGAAVPPSNKPFSLSDL